MPSRCPCPTERKCSAGLNSSGASDGAEADCVCTRFFNSDLGLEVELFFGVPFLEWRLVSLDGSRCGVDECLAWCGEGVAARLVDERHRLLEPTGRFKSRFSWSFLGVVRKSLSWSPELKVCVKAVSACRTGGAAASRNAKDTWVRYNILSVFCVSSQACDGQNGPEGFVFVVTSVAQQSSARELQPAARTVTRSTPFDPRIVGRLLLSSYWRFQCIKCWCQNWTVHDQGAQSPD